ncbi:zinc-dependent alcohol dehydrogenase family protein [Actinokineospora inagensis]|uniref:zinc-dependent alcohol dehydrogenase family protein n=1 Tax=Actinokineospora inagensis TaxID=103730 RepID=UPI00041E01B9|nr:zinc-dependent alcohol dehydrogenase family protein [Actinokineospora inagensis]
MARIVRFHELGGPEVLRVEEYEPAAPGPGEVLVDVAAIGLNRAEASYRRGRYFEQPRVFPASLGYEAAGTVAAVGEGVTGIDPGAAVSVLPSFSMNDYAVYAERTIVPAASLVALPEGFDAAAGAAVWMPYLTAFGGLVDVAGLGAGDPVVITAASSSVGLAAIRVARQVGAVPVALTRTAAKVDAVRAAGAEHVVVTDEVGVTAGIEAAVGAARVVFDPVAGPGVADLAAATAPGGTLVIYGGLSGEPTPFPRSALANGLALRGFLLFEIMGDPARRARALDHITEHVRRGDYPAAIDRTFGLADIVAAHEYLESNRQIGKIVVTVP